MHATRSTAMYVRTTCILVAVVTKYLEYTTYISTLNTKGQEGKRLHTLTRVLHEASKHQCEMTILIHM